jgi:hypothetical protein
MHPGASIGGVDGGSGAVPTSAGGNIVPEALIVELFALSSLVETAESLIE